MNARLVNSYWNEFIIMSEACHRTNRKSILSRRARGEPIWRSRLQDLGSPVCFPHPKFWPRYFLFWKRVDPNRGRFTISWESERCRRKYNQRSTGRRRWDAIQTCL